MEMDKRQRVNTGRVHISPFVHFQMQVLTCNITGRALLDHKKFAEELKKLGKTQEEFAEDMDMSDRYVRILSTVDRNVSISLAYAFSQAFGVLRILLSKLLGERRWTQMDLSRATQIRPNTINDLYHEMKIW